MRETLMTVSGIRFASFCSLSAFLPEGKEARFECVIHILYLTEIELSLAGEQRDENENGYRRLLASRH